MVTTPVDAPELVEDLQTVRELTQAIDDLGDLSTKLHLSGRHALADVLWARREQLVDIRRANGR